MAYKIFGVVKLSSTSVLFHEQMTKLTLNCIKIIFTSR